LAVFFHIYIIYIAQSPWSEY